MPFAKNHNYIPNRDVGDSPPVSISHATILNVSTHGQTMLLQGYSHDTILVDRWSICRYALPNSYKIPLPFTVKKPSHAPDHVDAHVHSAMLAIIFNKLANLFVQWSKINVVFTRYQISLQMLYIAIALLTLQFAKPSQTVGSRSAFGKHGNFIEYSTYIRLLWCYNTVMGLNKSLINTKHSNHSSGYKTTPTIYKSLVT